jgi:hypothetical protein
MVNTALNNASLVRILSIQIFFTCETLYNCLVCSDFVDTDLSHNYASCPSWVSLQLPNNSNIWRKHSWVELKFAKFLVTDFESGRPGIVTCLSCDVVNSRGGACGYNSFKFREAEMTNLQRFRDFEMQSFHSFDRLPFAKQIKLTKLTKFAADVVTQGLSRIFFSN